MINDGNQYKIVHSGYGAFSVEDCTVENAMALLESRLENLGDHITVAADAIRDKTHYIVSASLVVSALNELLSAKIGQELPKVTRLIHGKPAEGEVVKPVVFKATHLAKVTAWAQANGIALTNLKELTNRASYELDKMNPKSLFLFDGIYKRAGKLEPMFVDSEILQIADELSILKKNTWKATAKESSVVQRYLTFISENLMHRDEKVDLGTYSGSGE